MAANDVNGKVGLPEITIDGILCDNIAQAQALVVGILADIEMNLDILESLEGIIFPDRNLENPDFQNGLEEAARGVYRAVTGRDCPEGLKVQIRVFRS